MPELMDSNQLWDLFKTGNNYKILRIISSAKELNEKYPNRMLFWILREEEMKKLQEEKNTADIINLEEARLALAGKDPPGSGSNWLSKMEKGSRFLASRRSMGDCILLDFCIGSDPKAMPAVFMGFELNHKDGGFRFVDPVKFSRDYEFYMTLEVRPEDDGNSIPTGTVEGDGERQIVDSVDESE